MLAFLTSVIFYIAVLHAKSKRHKQQLTFLRHDRAKKKALFDHPITRKDASYSVRLTITPSALTTPNGVQNMNINWFNSKKGASTDWIGIYSPANSSDDEYLDHFHSDGQTNGTYQVRIWNMRDSYQARYFAESDKSQYILQGISEVASVQSNQPLQGHISLTDRSPNEVWFLCISYPHHIHLNN